MAFNNMYREGLVSPDSGVCSTTAQLSKRSMQVARWRMPSRSGVFGRVAPRWNLLGALHALVVDAVSLVSPAPRNLPWGFVTGVAYSSQMRPCTDFNSSSVIRWPVVKYPAEKPRQRKS